MKSADAWAHYYEHSGSASSGARKLAFTGIALVWIFSGGGLISAEDVTIHGRFRWPLAFLVVALAVDFLQYVTLSVIWRVMARRMEIAHAPDDEFDVPWQTNLVAESFFFAKLALVAIGYVWLLSALSRTVL